MTLIRRTRIPALFAMAVLVILFGRIDRAATQEPAAPRAVFRGTLNVAHFDVSPPLRDLIAMATPQKVEEEEDKADDRPTGLEGPLGPQDADARVQSEAGVGDIPSPSASFDAISNLCNCSPPDPNGAVGPFHYVTMTNLHFAIYAKSNSALLYGPAANNTLWAGFGGACQTENAGDPVVLYDRFADRWLLTQFTSAGPTYYNCVALSQTGDPTGAYYRWAFTTGSNFPDYPKYGVWRDGYYISTREFAGANFAGDGAYALNRAQMAAGNPNPTEIAFLVPPSPAYATGDGLLPADIDGPTLPPLGSSELFIGSQDNGGPYGAPFDALNVFRFHADFVTPANSTFTGPISVIVGAFDSILDACGGTRNCVPQPGTTNRLDHLGYRQRPLHRAAYRNFGTHESIVTNQSVETSSVSGVRWWELRNPNGAVSLFQEGTYAPADGIHRWMGSIAQDHAGDMALGFSASHSSALYPSIRYTGRLVTDTLGTMGLGEGTIVTGTGSQTGSQRWGDYSAMSVDPSDDCRFWFTSEYIPTTSSNGWRTRIGTFKYPQCEARRPANDRDGDFKTDRIVYRPSNGTWYAYLSVNGLSTATSWGTSTDIDVMADYDGDGRNDFAVWRPSTGTWFILQSSTGTVRTDAWGTNGDIPMGGDVGGDGIADLVIFRPSTGAWYAKHSSGGTGSALWGASGDYPMLGDRDGDGIKDPIVYRPSTGVWYYFLSSGGTGFVSWGTTGDIPVAGDFDGDGIVDPAIFRPSTGQWFVSKSTGGTLVASWGVSTDIPIAGDFDGDGKSDFTIYRPSTGVWYTQYSSSGSIGVLWGVSTDRPVGRPPGT